MGANPFSTAPKVAKPNLDVLKKELAQIESQIEFYTRTRQQAPSTLMNRRVQLRTQLQQMGQGP